MKAPDMARYIKYLENQHENIANRGEMPSKKWWDRAPALQEGLQALYP